jgi:hypothetical protein
MKINTEKERELPQIDSPQILSAGFMTGALKHGLL